MGCCPGVASKGRERCHCADSGSRGPLTLDSSEVMFQRGKSIPSDQEGMRLRTAVAACVTLLCASAGVSIAGAQDIFLSRAPNREETIIDGARREGQVVLYSGAIVNQALRPLADAFMKAYPFVKMTFWRGDSEEIIAKLSAEARAKNLVADVA